MALVVYGIPTCGTVRKARAWMDARGLEHEFVDLRVTPPQREQVARWVAAFGARALINTSGGSYRALGPEREGWDEARWVEAFQQDPMLIKRPVVERDGAPLGVGFHEASAAQRFG
ncbi:MAG TPA: Spx/MgsR family RNA polymerase-binding regulatory protein [Myxococcota bacterium]|nr:Spx/MgsR family RNA polymerase-binding regulatory protein [Myxococcota bacterium]